MAEILNAHGSKNDIFVAAMTPRDFASDAGLRAFVRRLCDRAGPFGGDGIYLYDAAAPIPEAWFFNPDGSSAEFCGNGMRCLGRVVLDRRGADAAVIRSGQAEYTVRRAATTGEGVRQIGLEHPAVDFTPQAPVVAGRNPLTEARLPELDPALEFTAVSIGNPHLVALVNAPGGFAEILGELPGTELTESLDDAPEFDVIVFFVTWRAELQAELGRLRRRMAPACGLWIAWPKRAAKVPTDMSDNVVREVALPTGLVDNKVCAIDATWSALRLVIRKELR